MTKKEFSRDFLRLVPTDEKKGENESDFRNFRRNPYRKQERNPFEVSRAAPPVAKTPLFRTLILVVALFGLPTMAVCWERLPTFGAKFHALLKWEEKEDFAGEVEHADAPVTTDPNSVVTNSATWGNGFDGGMAAVPRGGEGNRTPEALESFVPELERLGVRSGQLGRWGENGTLWRYVCRVQPSPDAGFTREFEATGATPAEAIRAAAKKIARCIP